MKEIALNDGHYFELFIGKRILKSQVFNSIGDIPAYSANVFQPFGFLSSTNITDFKHNYILWGIDGKFEFNVIKKDKKFATTDHCGTIEILDDRIIPEYLQYELELQSKIWGYDRNLRPSLTIMKEVIVKIPADEHGDFDIVKQQKIVKKYLQLKSLKNELNIESEELDSVNVKIELPKNCIILKIDELFDLNETTNRSYFTSEFVNKNKGDIPVYSTSKDPNIIAYGHIKDNLPNVKYFENILTWNIDGSVGRAFFRKGRFSLSEKVIPLILKDIWKEKIDLNYVKYIMEIKAVEGGFSFSNKAGKTRIKDIEIEIPIKTQNGQTVPDIDKQKEIALTYEKIYGIKNTVIQALQDVHEVTVDIAIP